MNEDVAAAFIEHARYRLMEDYYPKIEECVNQFKEEEIWWRPNENSNSVGNLILHLCGNMRQWMVSGLGGEEDVRNRPSEFCEKGPIPKQELLNRLKFVLDQVDLVLTNWDTRDMLSSRTVQGFEETPLTMIFHIVEHFAQHLGQIIYITKMRNNVDLNFFNLEGERGYPVD